jgi:hypothetical protein
MSFQKETALVEDFVSQGAKPFTFQINKNVFRLNRKFFQGHNTVPLVCLDSIKVSTKKACPCCKVENEPKTMLHLLHYRDLELFIVHCGCGHEREIITDELTMASRIYLAMFREDQ